MVSFMIRLFAVLLLLVWALIHFSTPARGETTVYKCGTLYTDKPCPDATVMKIGANQNAIPLYLPPKKESPVAAPLYLPPGYYLPPPSRFATGFTGYSYQTPYGQITAPYPINMSLSASNNGYRTQWRQFSVDGVTYHNDRPGPYRR